MSFSVIISAIFGAFIFLISFLLSIQSNTILDAVTRSFVVFLFSGGAALALLIFIDWYYHQTTTGQISDQDLSADQQNSEETKLRQNEEDSHKGEHIDFQTPEEEEFQPFQPQSLRTEGD